jgi:hypothetical protein
MSAIDLARDFIRQLQIAFHHFPRRSIYPGQELSESKVQLENDSPCFFGSRHAVVNPERTTVALYAVNLVSKGCGNGFRQID